MATDRDDFVALLEKFGYTRTTNPTDLSGPRYLEDVRADGGACVILGDGGACPAQAKSNVQLPGCDKGCCCQFCFCKDGTFLCHCCCCKCPPCANPKP